MKLVNDVIKILNPSKVLIKADNYLRIEDGEGNLKEYQFHNGKCLWYEFKTEGTSDNPKEIFIQWM